jgi:asparagine synthase (glutamine-hydrolysing)
MFRYIAIAWDPSQPASVRTAGELGANWHARPHWTPALVLPGLQVFTIGTQSGRNEVLSLPGGRGVILGRLFRRSDLGSPPPRSFRLLAREGARILDSRGSSLVTDFWGRYVAFMVTSPPSVCVLRDPSGALPCFRFSLEGVSVVFSWLEDALHMLGDLAPSAVNWEALIAHLRLGTLGGRETALAGVNQVLPGELHDLDKGKATMLWNAADAARSRPETQATDAAITLEHTVRACTQAWASCHDSLLLRLSGGVDSSIVISCLDPGSTASDVIGVNYYSTGSDSDEREYARLAAASAKRDLLERERDPGFDIARTLRVARTPGPVNYIGWMNSIADAQLACAHDATAMFTGAGGDPLFYEYPRWWPAADYLRDKGWDWGFLAAAMDAARLGRLSIWQTLHLALKERLRPDLAARAPVGPTGLLAPQVLEAKLDHRRFTNPAINGAADLPIGKYMQLVGLLYPLGYYDPFEQSNAPELVNPLFSQPLVELCLSLPTYVLTQGGRGRALARRAFASRVPAQIMNRRSKGGMEEHIKLVLNSNIELVREMLLEGQLQRHRLIDRARLEQLLSGRPSSLTGAVSQIHALVGVEAWLNRWNG